MKNTAVGVGLFGLGAVSVLDLELIMKLLLPWADVCRF